MQQYCRRERTTDVNIMRDLASLVLKVLGTEAVIFLTNAMVVLLFLSSFFFFFLHNDSKTFDTPLPSSGEKILRLAVSM